MRAKPLVLTGWGRAIRANTRAFRPERRSEALAALLSGEARPSIIPFGAGRSYGDTALNDGGATILTGRLDRFLDFDPEGDLLVCEPGVTFRQIEAAFLPRGLIAPVSPGTAFATIGGAVANDVHGKNHDRVGSFGDHVAWVDLALPSGEIVRASPQENPGLFAATIGGIGLTGLMVAVAFRMKRVPSGHMVVREQRLPDIGAFMAALVEARRSAAYSVGWIDAVAKGAGLGRGILQTADFASADQAAPASGAGPREMRLPVDLPGIVLNRHSIGLFNHLYYTRVPADGRERVQPAGKFLYPLDAIRDWNRMYGKNGFHQFQCVIPDGEAERGIPALVEAIAGAGSASFLAVLKTLGGPGRGHLSFPMSGFTLALDFPVRAGTAELMARLERLVLAHGGRIYLAKDASLSPEGFRRMYPRLPEFRAVLDRVDPDRRLGSDMSRRLRIREAA
ncbi:MAG TPA: FAD-binding oxidoreductase [Azospirillaceae bacterium]|nr:FAD-binding oxidoreductase [Azospirillaceae bacterium]